MAATERIQKFNKAVGDIYRISEKLESLENRKVVGKSLIQIHETVRSLQDDIIDLMLEKLDG